MSVVGGIGRIFDREGGFMLCWRLNFNSFCTPLPMTFMFHRGYDCVKICLDQHAAKTALVILLFDFFF